MREKLHLRFRARSRRPLKRVSHFISILLTLFSQLCGNSFTIWINRWWCVYGSTYNVQIVSIYLVINLIGILFSFLRDIIDSFHASSNRCPVSFDTQYYFQKRSAHARAELFWFTPRFINTLRNVILLFF